MKTADNKETPLQWRFVEEKDFLCKYLAMCLVWDVEWYLAADGIVYHSFFFPVGFFSLPLIIM